MGQRTYQTKSRQGRHNPHLFRWCLSLNSGFARADAPVVNFTRGPHNVDGVEVQEMFSLKRLAADIQSSIVTVLMTSLFSGALITAIVKVLARAVNYPSGMRSQQILVKPPSLPFSPYL